MSARVPQAGSCVDAGCEAAAALLAGPKPKPNGNEPKEAEPKEEEPNAGDAPKEDANRVCRCIDDGKEEAGAESLDTEGPCAMLPPPTIGGAVKKEEEEAALKAPDEPNAEATTAADADKGTGDKDRNTRSSAVT